jgi:purine-binding chemotaxis protein CheW
MEKFMSQGRQFCTFSVDQYFFGIDISHVQEVIRYQEMTEVPLAHPVIRGLINLRGQIVTALDMRRRLGFPPLEAGRFPMNVVIRRGEGVLSLLVDEISDVMDVSVELFENPPENLKNETRVMIHHVCKLKDRLLLVLDLEQLLNLEPAKI